MTRLETPHRCTVARDACSDVRCVDHYGDVAARFDALANAAASVVLPLKEGETWQPAQEKK